MARISAIICTHNPREEYLRRVLDGLRAQTLPRDQWELLLIDNASQVPLSGRVDLSWHALGRHVCEEDLGLTPARLRGIRESQGEVLVFVDDDTVLAENYLEEALRIGEAWPFVGVWGGNIRPEFEVPVPDWCGKDIWRLTVMEVKEDVWSNLREGFATIPAGAGMCFRQKVGQRFLEWSQIQTASKGLDRKGKALTGYGDVDLAHCALDLGLGTGKSTRLTLTHLIPASRLTLDYFIRHTEGDMASLMMFRELRGLPVEPPDFSFLANLRWRLHCLFSRQSAERIQLEEAHRRGMTAGWTLIQQHRAQNPGQRHFELRP